MTEGANGASGVPGEEPHLQATVGGVAAYGGKPVKGFMFGLKEGGGLVVWEGELRRGDKQWAEVPPMPEAESELRRAFDSCMARAPQGAISRRGRGTRLPVVLVGPNGKARVDAGLRGQKQEHLYERLTPATCEALMGLWKIPLAPADLPRDRPATIRLPAELGGGFELESDLEDYMVDHWKDISLSATLELAGSQVQTTDGGRIDLLCSNKDGSGYTVIELKRGTSNDKALGQLQRYMGWVRANKARGDQSVWGIIICREVDAKLSAALDVATNVDAYTYDADGDHFVLYKHPRQN